MKRLSLLCALCVLCGYSLAAAAPANWRLAEGPFPYPGPPPGTQCLFVNPAPGCNTIVMASTDPLCRTWKVMRVDLYRDGGIYGHALLPSTWGTNCIITYHDEPINSTLKALAVMIPGVNSFVIATGQGSGFGVQGSGGGTVNTVYPAEWSAQQTLDAYQQLSAAELLSPQMAQMAQMGRLASVKSVPSVAALRPSGLGAKVPKLNAPAPMSAARAPLTAREGARATPAPSPLTPEP